ncbi:MAG TPA: immune inhibitor A, partial [Candidatus Methanofastidiosa archaeon]|nr:immune inhibitor A [Candidatus Methanofastidiosa archaeon]
TLNGRSSINAQVTGTTFEDIYTDWTLANLLDDTTLVGPNSGAALGFESYDVGSADTRGDTMLSYHWLAGAYSLNWDYGPYPYVDPAYGLEEGYPSPDTGFYWVDSQQQLDANYFLYEAPDTLSVFNFEFLGNKFNDASFQITQPSMGDLEWYSQSGNGWYDGAEHTLTYTFDFSLVTGPITMDIDTWVDIEDGWDFGYVEVSVDGGTNWVQLQDLDGVMNNFRDPAAYVGVPGAYAFSNEGAGWFYDVTFDLSAYANTADVMVRFNYTTDDASAPYGWVVDNIRVYNGGQILDGTDASDATWTSDGWLHTDTISTLEWTVYCVGFSSNESPGQNDIYEVELDAITGDGLLQMPSFGGYYDYIVIVPSMVTGENIGGNYEYYHAGDVYSSPSGAAPVASTFTIFNNAQAEIIEELDKTLYIFKVAESQGYDVSEIEPLFDMVNEDVSQANSGVNWVFRAGKLLSAMETLGTIQERLSILMD